MPRYGLRLKRSLHRPVGRFRSRHWPFVAPGAQRSLLDWFSKNGRRFPWRETQASPWGRLVAEMLLRKTTAAQVSKVWPVLVERYPTPAELSRAHPAEVEEIVRPLGLSRQRTEALKDTAHHILAYHGGEVPASKADLLAIPHVGPYTAHAIQTFVFGIPVPLVDVNILRIFARYFGLRTSTLNPHREEHIWRRAKRIVPLGRVAEFQLALLDLAALVCKPRKPHCEGCPLGATCREAAVRGE